MVHAARYAKVYIEEALQDAVVPPPCRRKYGILIGSSTPNLTERSGRSVPYFRIYGGSV